MQKTNFKQAKSHINLKNIELYYQNDIQTEAEEIDRCYSTTDENYSLNDDFISKDQDEELLIELAKTQRKLSNYSVEPNNIGYTSRNVLFNWVEKVTTHIGIPQSNQVSIYYRFTTLYDKIMEQMRLQGKTIASNEELKKLIVTIFLIAYKFEGHSIGKITISGLINAFLKNSNVNQRRMTTEIRKIEISILQSIEYNVYLINCNLHVVSYTILTLFRNHYCLSDDLLQLIELSSPKMNKHILLSGEVLFDTLPIDNSVISLFATWYYIKRGLEEEIERKSVSSQKDSDSFNNQLLIKEIAQIYNEVYDYLKSELKVIKLTIEECKYFAFKFSEELRKCHI